MDISPYLSALSRFYHMKKLPAADGMRVWKVRKKGILPSESFFLAFSDLFYLPENEHKMKAALANTKLPVQFPWQTPKVVVLCSYNGMGDLTGDDLRSFTDKALISYQLLERENRIWIGSDTFYPGGSPIPGAVRAVLCAAEAMMAQTAAKEVADRL